MARTSINVPTMADAMQIYNVVNGILRSNGYTERMQGQERIWAKGDGTFIAMQCAAVQYYQGQIVLQGWIYDSILGESNLEAKFFGALPKKKLKKLLEQIAENIKLLQPGTAGTM